MNDSLSYIDVPLAPQNSLEQLSIGEFLRQAAQKVPNRNALICANTGKTWSYETFLGDAEHCAQLLLQQFSPGDHIATWAMGSTDLLTLHFGAALAGLVLATINPACREDEVGYMLQQSKARGLFLDKEFRGLDNQACIETIQNNLSTLEQVTFMQDWSNYVATPIQEKNLPTVAHDGPALILFTSGTTGKPKAAVLSHQTVVNNSRLGSQCITLTDGGVWLNMLPLFHIGGSSTMTLGCIANLGTQVLLPAFTPELMIDSIEKYKVTVAMAVPTMLVAMLDTMEQNKEFADKDLSSLKVMVTGGTTVVPTLVHQVRERVDVDIMTLFGQTEASGTMCVTRLGDDIEHITQTVGKPLPGSIGKIISSETGKVIPYREIGEICIKASTIMLEYFNMPEQTASAIDAGGWLHTGDLGYMQEDGYIQITGRLKEMIIRGGENIYPREIEDRLAEHPAISQSAIFAVPDEKWGEQVAAAVVIKMGQEANEEQLTDYLISKIAKHKVPKIWLFVNELPLNASGKVQKFLLREQLEA